MRSIVLKVHVGKLGLLDTLHMIFESQFLINLNKKYLPNCFTFHSSPVLREPLPKSILVKRYNEKEKISIRDTKTRLCYSTAD